MVLPMSSKRLPPSLLRPQADLPSAGASFTQSKNSARLKDSAEDQEARSLKPRVLA
jgi:hypothetical protein